ncbi:hypothetical protein ACFWPU_00935 [Streptomyces sp. NPDC058471]
MSETLQQLSRINTEIKCLETLKRAQPWSTDVAGNLVRHWDEDDDAPGRP